MSVLTVFGGTGFLGRQIVKRMSSCGYTVRIAARHPARVSSPPQDHNRIKFVRADVRDVHSIVAAIDGAHAVVNAVGLYVEKGDATFHAVHVKGAEQVAAISQRYGVKRLVHISGIGADIESRSSYVRCRAEGEAAVRAVSDSAIIFRPSVMFGQDDAFLTTLVSLARRYPLLPLFGRGLTRLQPVFVDDVAEAVAAVLAERQPKTLSYELGGPNVYTYRELIDVIVRSINRRRLFVPVPYFVWDGLAAAARVLSTPPVTTGQVALMKRDNVASPDAQGLRHLNITPTSLESVLRDLIAFARSDH